MDIELGVSLVLNLRNRCEIGKEDPRGLKGKCLRSRTMNGDIPGES